MQQNPKEVGVIHIFHQRDSTRILWGFNPISVIKIETPILQYLELNPLNLLRFTNYAVFDLVVSIDLHLLSLSCFFLDFLWQIVC